MDYFFYLSYRYYSLFGYPDAKPLRRTLYLLTLVWGGWILSSALVVYAAILRLFGLQVGITELALIIILPFIISRCITVRLYSKPHYHLIETRQKMHNYSKRKTGLMWFLLLTLSYVVLMLSLLLGAYIKHGRSVVSIL